MDRKHLKTIKIVTCAETSDLSAFLLRLINFESKLSFWKCTSVLFLFAPAKLFPKSILTFIKDTFMIKNTSLRSIATLLWSNSTPEYSKNISVIEIYPCVQQRNFWDRKPLLEFSKETFWIKNTSLRLKETFLWSKSILAFKRYTFRI